MTVYSPTPNGGNCDLDWEWLQSIPAYKLFGAIPKPLRYIIISKITQTYNDLTIFLLDGTAENTVELALNSNVLAISLNLVLCTKRLVGE